MQLFTEVFGLERLTSHSWAKGYNMIQDSFATQNYLVIVTREGKVTDNQLSVMQFLCSSISTCMATAYVHYLLLWHLESSFSELILPTSVGLFVQKAIGGTGLNNSGG